MSPPPAVVIVVAVGVSPDALKGTTDLLVQFGVPYVEAAGAPVAPVAGARLVIVASAEQATPAAWAKTGVPTVRVPVSLASSPAGVNLGERLALLVPRDGEPPVEGGFATVAIGEAGARNAALFAVSVLAAGGDTALREAWVEYRRTQTETVLAQTLSEEEGKAKGKRQKAKGQRKTF